MTNRPKEFDARVLAYMPGLKNLARKFTPKTEEQLDLVTDTIIVSLHRWRSFRDDGGLWNWLAFNMRSTAQIVRDKERRTIKTVYDDDNKHSFLVGVPPTQEHALALSQTLALMTGRDGAVVLRQAMGDDLKTIGNTFGVSPERARQLGNRGRESLAKRVSPVRLAA